MPRTRGALLATMALAAMACPGPRAGSKGAAKNTTQVDLTALTIPPGPSSEAALRRLRGAGSTEAAWARTHYLIDLFDDARYRRARRSKDTLARALGRAPRAMSGAQATRAVIDALLIEVDRVLRRDRLHPGAQAARTLLELDQKPATARSQIFARMALLKAVARGGGPVADNAALRLFAYCRTAMGAVVRARWADRMRLLAHCLYPLFDADPAPYFAADPAQRPPPPAPAVLIARLRSLLAPAAKSRRRTRTTAAHLTAQLDRFARSHAGALPTALDPTELALPRVSYALPYDWTPLLRLTDGAIADANKLTEEMTMLVQGDGRKRIALTMPAQAPASRLLGAARIALDSRAIDLELLVSFDQALAVPAGDYWSGRARKNRVQRAAVIPVSLIPMVPPADRPRGPRRQWDTTRAALQLHLTVEQHRWHLFGPSGTVADFPTRGGSGAAKLRAALAHVRAAFDFERALVLVPAAGVSYGAVLSAADAAARDAAGSPSFHQLGLATTAPPIKHQLLSRRIERRRRAAVDVVPADLARQKLLLRRCYQERLEDKPSLAGTIRVELQGDRVAALSGPSDRLLRRCVIDALQVPMVRDKVASAEVTFAPR